ncbi:unnamed protein product [Caenorhabditis brenneri]
MQVGSAHVTVLKETYSEPGPIWKGSIKTVKLSLRLLNSITSSPRGAEIFADTLIELIHKYDPFKDPLTHVGMIFESPEIEQCPGLTYTPIRRLNPAKIVENMEQMSQSSRSPLELENPFITTIITYLKKPSGSGKRRFDTGDILELTEFHKKPKYDGSVEEEEIDDDDSSKSKGTRSNIMPNEVLEDCLPHALYQALMYNQWKQCRSIENKNKYRSSIRKTYKRPGTCSEVYHNVQQLKEKAEVTKSSNFDRLDIEQFQKTVFARTHQIVAFVKNSTTPFYLGPYVGEGKQLVIYLADGHYRGVRSICALLKTDYYCFLCDVKYKDSSSHYKCPLIHRLCGHRNCDTSDGSESIRCQKCTINFHSRGCYDNHLKNGPNGGKSRCDYTIACKKCGEVYYTNKNKDQHKCGEKWCYRCNCKRSKTHHCIMAKSKKCERKITRKRVYFDIESRADEKTGRQIPVLFVALRCCKACSPIIPKDHHSLKNETCEECAPDGRLKIIENITSENQNVDVAAECTRWLFADHHKGYVVVAHNASGYDGQFILEQLITSSNMSPKLILEGTKLVFMEYNNVRLLDSMKFWTTSLSGLGKSFEVDSIKGDFPVLFIKPENYGYNGSLPEDKFYNLEKKSTSVKKQIMDFLETERNANTIFNFNDELIKYCYNDVYILAKALNIFETEFEKMTNVCLLEESTTAASAAALVFRRNHLHPEKPIVLDVKPSVSINNSVVSQKYLAWFGRKEGVQVNMSTTYGEEKIGKYHVDGFIPKCKKFPEGLIIEFFGCYWHAHDCTYTEASMIGNKSGSEIWKQDEERIKYLEARYPVKVVWECDVKKELLENSEMAEFFESYEPVGILHCEKSLAGGRTEVFRLHANNHGRRLRYLDVVSLYPTVMKHEAFPIGSPENVPRSSLKTPMTVPEDITFRGFLNCRVLPPDDLKLPLLPIKYSGKLLFGLCRQCVKELNKNMCQHSNEQRAFNGTFTTAELRKALSLGYIITDVYHGIKYENWVQNDEHGEGGLFTSYINQMMEEKIYSSGWPSNVNTKEEKEAFVKQYKEKENIDLSDHSRFEKNPGKRAVAKLMLNSLWGKFAQNVDRETTSIISDPCKLWRLVYETDTVISLVRCVNDVLIVKHKKQVETLESLKTSAMQLATYTTSYARLRLYRFMELVGGDNIIYTDTDSIIYAIPDGTSDPLEKEVGAYLGQLTDEVDGTMTDFVSLGPKTYCYKEMLGADKEKIVRKAKGICLNTQADKLISFEAMKKMVEEVLRNEAERTVQQIPQFTMKRDHNHRVYSCDIKKSFKYTFNKRIVLNDGSTLPYGYKHVL